MKLKITYKIPSVSVSETIEIGNVANNKLGRNQSKKVDKLISEVLAPRLEKALKDKMKPKVIMNTV
ncbi:MAG: hypothetical protein QM503_04685 [Bacteroidota bacterium]